MRRSGLGLAEARARAASIVKAARQGCDLLAEEKTERLEEKTRLRVSNLIERYVKKYQKPFSQGWRPQVGR